MIHVIVFRYKMFMFQSSYGNGFANVLPVTYRQHQQPRYFHDSIKYLHSNTFTPPSSLLSSSSSSSSSASTGYISNLNANKNQGNIVDAYDSKADDKGVREGLHANSHINNNNNNDYNRYDDDTRSGEPYNTRDQGISNRYQTQTEYSDMDQTLNYYYYDDDNRGKALHLRLPFFSFFIFPI